MRLAPLYLGAALVVTSQSEAASFFLDQTNINQPPFTDGKNYLTVTTQASGDDITFTVDALNDSGGPFAGHELSNFGIQAFGFNVVDNGVSNLSSSNISNLPNGWTVDFNRRLNGFGRFDVVVSGPGNDRQDPLTFSITGINGDTPDSYHGPSSGTAGEGNAWYAAHVADFSGAGKTNGKTITSGYFGGGDGPEVAPTPVPVPGAVWLFGSAIAGLGLVSRRSRNL
ncbi:VPLPA-CTERM sorting domain-containing protein [Methylocaldum szegediense]|mgnify:CR=1 FL=1|jgi:hypothetical protein|uniref:Secreted protein with PEP-CTERM sorting signal n=1 Tax=Methylocaldum szegediense TaxID=73780 RepID=A0ABM9HZD0_9GAMM|nr:VPLPA-CTERM sorting domain-containing protein [Methylocaldum szegediense]CAI8788083.1 putative secreted protein with PEP-CTERM sorting signal [Methylocaldum szegediense]